MASNVADGTRTIFENPTAQRLFYPFLGEAGAWLAPGEQKAIDGDLFSLMALSNATVRRSLQTALAQGKLAIAATPQVILTDTATGALKAVAATSGALALASPTWGAEASADAFLISVSPLDGARSVAAGATVVARFSAAVTGATIALAVAGKGTAVSGATVASDGNATYTFTPSAALTGGAAYVATVSGAVDANGNTVAAATATFSVAPTVSSIVPAAAATGVSTGTAITVTFNEPVTGVAFSVTKSGTAVAGATAASSKNAVWTFTPAAALSASTLYTVAVTGGVDGTGNTMATYNSTFTTGTS